MGPARRTYTRTQRQACVRSWYQSNKVMKTAVALLLASWVCQWGPKPPAPADLIRRTAARFEASGSVFDLPRSGRKKKLTDAMARKAAKIFKGGYEVFRSYGRGRPVAIERSTTHRSKRHWPMSQPWRPSERRGA